MISLEVKSRKQGEGNSLRESGDIPAVFYGKKEKSSPISVKLADFSKVWKEAGESSVITLKTEDGDKEALIYDVQFDPVTDAPQHIDFYVFEKGHKVEVEIPIEFVGVAPAVKELGGTLVKVLHELKIEAQPKDLPHQIEVDVSTLVSFDSQIQAKDLKLPEGVTLVERAEEVVALVEEAKEEEEETVDAQPDLSSIEVEKKGKKDEEEQPVGDVKSEKSEKTEK